MRQFLILIILAILPILGYSETSSEFIKIHVQKFDDLEVPPALVKSLAGSKIILIGESHGTNEIPEYTFSLIKKITSSHAVAFGLEFPIEIQDQIESFLKTGNETILSGLDFFKDANYHSGRGSHAMIQLLRNLRALPDLKVFCFDISKSQNEGGQVKDRDTELAKSILNFSKKNPDRLIITFSGNIHSRLTIGFPSDPNHKNMGSEILRLSKGSISLKNSRSILFRYGEGSAWQCWFDQDKNNICGVNSFGPSKSVYATAVSADRYFLHEPEITDGHSESIFIRKVSGSPPWVPSTK